jgi:N-ethylmaleimide reductase
MRGKGAADIFAPVPVGPFTLPNRIVMAPMTRSRATADGLPSPHAATYYAQRASAGLIVSEAAYVAPEGVGSPGTPGICTEEQAAGWRPVTQAVHLRGGRIFLQLWHVGRISHPCMQPGGGLPVAPSAVAAQGHVFTSHGMQPLVTPRALETAEVNALVNRFAHAARMARAAGFDGIDLHAANGYLIDQFLRSDSNHRLDRYGGSVANRARLLTEIVEAVSAVWGPDRVGVRVSPLQEHNSMRDRAPGSLFGHVAEVLARIGIAYLHVVEPCLGHPMASEEGQQMLRLLRSSFPGPMVVDGGLDLGSAQAALAGTGADLVAFASPFIANPDLVERLAGGLPLATPDRRLFYEGGDHGYIDYPAFRTAPVDALGAPE